MSSQNYDSFQQGQYGPQDPSSAGAGAAPQQDSAMGAPLPENPQAPFQGGNGGDPSSAGGPSQGNDAKTTLWYVDFSVLIPSGNCISPMVHTGRPKPSLTRLIHANASLDSRSTLTSLLGWASSSHGSMRISSVAFGITWASKLMSR